MTVTRGILILSLLAVPALYTAAVSDDKKQIDETEGVRKSTSALAAAYNAHDAKAIAGRFTPTGEFVDADGDVFHGRAAIEAEFSALFKAGAGDHRVQVKPESIRVVAPGVAMEDGSASIASAESAPGASIEYTAVHVKQSDGTWLLASLRSEGEKEQTPHQRLQNLDWLIGDWVDESPESVVKTSTRWTENGNFIVSNFTVQTGVNKVLTGTQRIGWDPRRGMPMCWIFDSEGGHAEGAWTKEGESWIVTLSGVRPDGTAASATNVYTPQGPDSFNWESTNRVAGDQALPDLSTKVVRKPPEPKKSK